MSFSDNGYNGKEDFECSFNMLKGRLLSVKFAVKEVEPLVTLPKKEPFQREVSLLTDQY